MCNKALFLSVSLLLFAALVSCSTISPSNTAAVNQEEAKHYQKSLHYIAFDKDNKILVASTNGFIARIDDIEGKNPITYGTWGLEAGNFRALLGIAVDSKNRIYVVDQKNQRLVRIDDFTGNGWESFDFSSGELASIGIRGLCIDQNDRIYITDEVRHKIIRIDNIKGDNVVQFGSYGSGEMQFASPYTLDTDSLGRIYIADGGNSRIVRIDDMSGKGWVTFGKGGNGVGEFHKTYGVALDSKDRIIITNGNGRIVRIDDMSGSNWQELKPDEYVKGVPVSPAGINIDKEQRIFYIDYDNGRICRIDGMDGSGFASYSFEKE